ncbi:MAG: hypothetical protein AAGC63_16100 [Propionicimonas sp.]
MNERTLLTNVPGGPARLASAVELLNEVPFPPGVHHDVARPIPVVATLRWSDGRGGEDVEHRDTEALEWCPGVTAAPVVRIRLVDPRNITIAAWLPAADVRRIEQPRQGGRP